MDQCSVRVVNYSRGWGQSSCLADISQAIFATFREAESVWLKNITSGFESYIFYLLVMGPWASYTHKMRSRTECLPQSFK